MAAIPLRLKRNKTVVKSLRNIWTEKWVEKLKFKVKLKGKAAIDAKTSEPRR
jgi:hypothetical protein